MPGVEFHALVEHAPDAIVVSRDGIVLYANAAAARLLGHDDVSEIVGKPMTFLDRRSAELMRQRIEQMATSGERLVAREYPARRRDGSEITAEIASAVIELDGAPAVLAYARDVTDRTRLRAQVARADRLAALGLMAAGVAHEINNPLAVIALAADGLAQRAAAPDAALIAEVRAGVDRIAAIVKDLSSYGRAGDEPPGRVDLGAAIAAAERLVAHEIRPRGTLVKEHGELPAVMGVSRHIEQVFVNLLLNSAHAMEDRTDGRIVLSARATDEHVVVSVEDDGCGIAPELLDVVFEPFFTTRAVRGGTGLGLSICRDLVTRSGGSLVAKGGGRQGTTMEVTLRRARLHPPEPAAVPTPPAQALAPKASLRMLVVDDEPLIVRALTAVLSRRGSVTAVSSAEQALALILTQPTFDAIVCDVMMPGMTGTDLHARVALEKPGDEARFVFITGGAYRAHTRDYLERLPNECFMKPFDRGELLAAVERVASLPKAGSATS